MLGSKRRKLDAFTAQVPIPSGAKNPGTIFLTTPLAIVCRHHTHLAAQLGSGTNAWGTVC
jgi:hypothetical protein